MLKDKLILVSFGISLVINIILWVMVASKFGLSAEQIPLHFNVVSGIDFVGSSRNLYQIPGAGLLIFLINIWLARAIIAKEKLFAYFLGFGSLVVQLFFLLTLAALFSLIG